MKKLMKKIIIIAIGFMMLMIAVPVTNLFESETVQAATKNGLYHEGMDWNYYVDGKLATGTTTLVKYNNSWWYVHNGKIDFGAKTLVRYNEE